MTREELNQDKQQEIIDEQKNEKRKKITIFFFKVALFIIVGFTTFYLYTSFVSTKILSINEHRIIDGDIPDSFNGLKVIQFSDLHYGTTVFINDIKKLVSKMNELNPDLVLFTGDLIDKNYSLKVSEQEQIIAELNKLNSSLGKYAIAGEEDESDFLTIMKQSNFEIINNSYDLIYKDNDEPIILVGVDSSISGKADINEAFKYYNEPSHNSNLFSITILHEPDSVDKILNQYSSDLILSGHSHNGTVRIPFIGGIYKYSGAEKYTDDFYVIDNSKLYVSGGIGTNGPGFRLFCRPSINFFRISNK